MAIFSWYPLCISVWRSGAENIPSGSSHKASTEKKWYPLIVSQKKNPAVPFIVSFVSLDSELLLLLSLPVFPLVETALSDKEDMISNGLLLAPIITCLNFVSSE